MAKHDNKAILDLAATLGGEALTKSESGSNASKFTFAGIAYGETKPDASDIDITVANASKVYRDKAGVTADEKSHKKMVSHLRAFITLGAMDFANKSPTGVANDILKAGAEKIKVMDHVTGEEKERNRITGAVREVIYSAAVYLKKHHEAGQPLANVWDDLLEHLEPAEDTAEKAMDAAHKALARVFGLATDEQIDALTTDDAATLAACFDLAARNPFRKSKAAVTNSRLEALRAKAKK